VRDASSRATKAFNPALSMFDMIFSGVFEGHPRLTLAGRLVLRSIGDLIQLRKEAAHEPCSARYSLVDLAGAQPAWHLVYAASLSRLKPPGP
jgi:hypothetical protein